MDGVVEYPVAKRQRRAEAEPQTAPGPASSRLFAPFRVCFSWPTAC